MLLTEFHGKASATIEAPPGDVFAAITAVDRLPQWNGRIARVIRAPDAPLADGVEWVVKMSVPPATWPSRSRVTTYDPVRLVFAHTSQSDDGNPSYAEWRWTVIPDAAGARVTVEWSVHPKTFWRRFLFAKLRRRQLQSEAPASLHALAYHLAPSEPAH
jgi:uncharacterized protein YndB with AHSA1/START domain